MNWNYPTTIWFGDQRINEIQKACESLNIQKPLIVTDPGILKTNIIEKINSSLTDKANIFSDVQSNPTGNNVELGVSYFNSNAHDGVIAVGGVQNSTSGGNQGDLFGDSTYLQKNVRRFACLPACLLACLPASQTVIMELWNYGIYI